MSLPEFEEDVLAAARKAAKAEAQQVQRDFVDLVSRRVQEELAVTRLLAIAGLVAALLALVLAVAR